MSISWVNSKNISAAYIIKFDEVGGEYHGVFEQPEENRRRLRVSQDCLQLWTMSSLVADEQSVDHFDGIA